MKRLIPYIAFACLTGFTATTGLPVMAGGCSSHMNKKAEIKFTEDHTDCQAETASKFELKDSLKSKNYDSNQFIYELCSKRFNRVHILRSR